MKLIIHNLYKDFLIFKKTFLYNYMNLNNNTLESNETKIPKKEAEN